MKQMARGLAAEVGTSLARYAIAWTLAHPAVTAAIVGPRILTQLDDLLPAGDVRIPPAHLEQIDTLVPPGTNA